MGRGIALCIGLLMLAGCRQVMYQNSKQVPNNIWESGHNIAFEVTVEDTVGAYDFYIDLRNTSTYGYANIYMFVNTTFPSGRTARDTVECILADRSGRWLGSGTGHLVDNHILFKQNIRFPHTGLYRFEFEQGMRDTHLEGIADIGISIEPHRKK